ncbi:hypothetical protein TNCV_4244881 [Trichonephila clavipes]|nr:hypothetical protein TNCV_4244881 [Trichonephila clavipes]
MAPFRLQLVKLLQVFGKLVRFYHGAIRNVLMQGDGKRSIVVEFRPSLQGHGSSKIFCCSVPLTTMRPPWTICLHFPSRKRRSTCVSKARFHGWGHTTRQGRFLSRCISQLSNHVNQVTYTSASRVLVREIQRVGFRILRLIRLPNLVRRGTTHAKELSVDSFIPCQIRMTRKHNDYFSKRTRKVHAKVGFKKDGIRIVWLVIRGSIRPPPQISKYDSGAMSTLVQQVLYRNHSDKKMRLVFSDSLFIDIQKIYTNSYRQLLTDRSMGWMALNSIDCFTLGFSLGIVKSIGANSLSNSSRNAIRSPSEIEGTV